MVMCSITFLPLVERSNILADRSSKAPCCAVLTGALVGAGAFGSFSSFQNGSEGAKRSSYSCMVLPIALKLQILHNDKR
jgi:hypothetical protein